MYMDYKAISTNKLHKRKNKQIYHTDMAVSVFYYSRSVICMHFTISTDPVSR